MDIDQIFESWTECLHDETFSTATEIEECANKNCENKVAGDCFVTSPYADEKFCSTECVREWFEYEGWELKEEAINDKRN